MAAPGAVAPARSWSPAGAERRRCGLSLEDKAGGCERQPNRANGLSHARMVAVAARMADDAGAIHEANAPTARPAGDRILDRIAFGPDQNLIRPECVNPI